MDDQEDLKLSQEVLKSGDPQISYDYTFYVLIVPDEGQVIVERVGTLVVVTKGAWAATEQLINDKYPDSKFEFNLPKNLRRQADRILEKARRKRSWQKDFLKDSTPTLFSPPIGLSSQQPKEGVAKSDSSTPQGEQSSQTSATTTKTEP